MKILLTGKNGQVGHSLTQLLKGENDVQLLALNSKELDITDKSAVDKAISDFSPDIIVNCAAYTAVDKAESEPNYAYKVNCDGPKFLAEAAEVNGAILIHISTDYVFDGESTSPYTEEEPTNPSSVYGKSKLEGEQAITDILERYVIIRTAWVFGEHGNNFVKTMLRLGKSHDQLSIVADQFGGPTYAKDLAKAIVNISKSLNNKSVVNPFGTYHYSGTPHANWYEFAELIFDQAKKQNLIKEIPLLKGISTKEYPTPARRPKNSRLDCNKIKETFGISPSNWPAGLAHLENYTD